MHGVVCGNEMARNSEKRLTGLNRFLEAKESRESLVNSVHCVLNSLSPHTVKKADLQRPPLVSLWGKNFFFANVVFYGIYYRSCPPPTCHTAIYYRHCQSL